MRVRTRLILMLLALSMLLSACGGAPANVAEDATVPAETVAATEPVVEATEPEVQEPAFLQNLPNRPQLSETVLPQENVATGTLKFYLKDKAIYAGAPVADLIEVGFHTYSDLSAEVRPWHTTGALRAEIDMTEYAGEADTFVYFVALNASDEPCMISECIIYSMTVTYQKGVPFGTGHEETPFVTGVTTRDELVAAYGEPTHTDSKKSTYEEIFYYQPFNCVSFLFRYGVLRQVNTYYSANIYGQVAESIDFDLTGNAMENDAMILMSQYLDVKPYMAAAQQEEAAETPAATGDKEEPAVKMQAELTEGTGILSSFSDTLQLNGSTITLGCQICELPEPYLEDLNNLSMPMGKDYYIRTGRHDPEEFLVINDRGQHSSMSNTLSIKGVIMENQNYCNWGVDNSAFHSFDAMGVTENSTIDDVLALFGAPAEMVPFSGERNCFVWMHYQTEAGDYIHIRVDPILNQVIEVNMVKHFEIERTY